MEEIYIHRKIEVWIVDTYRVEEINDDIIEQAINYDIDPDESETLWETQEDLGPITVFDHNYRILKEEE